jgi:hypothetical protein
VRSGPENGSVRRVTPRPSHHRRLRCHRAPTSPQRHPRGRPALRRRVTDADHRAMAFHGRAHESRCERDRDPHHSVRIRRAQRCARPRCSSRLFRPSCCRWRRRAAGVPSAGTPAMGIGVGRRTSASDRLPPAPSARSLQLGRHGRRRCRRADPQAVVPASIPRATAPDPARAAREGGERRGRCWNGIVRRRACRDTTDRAGRLSPPRALPRSIGRAAPLGRTSTSRAPTATAESHTA